MKPIHGERVTLRVATSDDVATLAAIRATPEVRARWGEGDYAADTQNSINEAELAFLAIVTEPGGVIGAIQYEEEEDPAYRHATIDLYLAPAVHGQGIGPDAVRALVTYLFDECGHHRLTIDPAADNARAIRAYEKVGFRPIGTLREYERAADGSWHDGLLMELLASEFRR